MCGRYSLTSPAEAIRAVFNYPERPNLPARANIAPTQEVAAVRLTVTDDGGAPGRHFAWLRWGLIPPWAKDRAIGNRLINARAESVADKPAFRDAFHRRRCLILADGFYEWRSEGGRRQPYRITLADGGPFAFAGLWERWRDRSAGETVESCTIVTTEANSLLRSLHDRMPVILDTAGHAAWLDEQTTAEAARALLRPYPADALVFYRVSPRINSPDNDDPALTAPIEEPSVPVQPRLL